MHEVLVNRSGGLSLPRKSVIRLTDHPDMTLDVYRGRKTTMQKYTTQSNNHSLYLIKTNKTTFLFCYERDLTTSFSDDKQGWLVVLGLTAF